APTIGDPDGLYLDAIQSVIGGGGGGGGVPGDYNENGTVDAADYTGWRDSLGQTGSNLPADGTGDGHVYRVDYTYWKTRFGSGAAGNGTAVPEPPGQALAWMTILLGMIFGRDGRPGDGVCRRTRCTSCF
ncbi:MAG: hypothetical protein MK161_07780, partial [Pirellulales bacterium]|nr:hypothetical protein [Pirellulales bacterium]